MWICTPHLRTTIRHFRLAAFAVVVLAAGVYANTLSYGAAWDDSRFVLQSGATRGVSGIPSLFASPILTDVSRSRSPYRPITATTYAIDWTLGGGRPAFFHRTNVALHAVVTLLVLLLLLRLGAGEWGALAGATLFAVHPVHVEAVANPSGRADLLAALFVISAVIVYLGPGHGSGRASPARAGPVGWRRGTTMMVLFALGLASKENAIVLPGLLVAVESLRTDGDGPPWKRVLSRWRLWLALTAVIGLYLLARHAVLGVWATADVAPFIAVLPTSTRITTAVANWLQYLRLLVFPLNLSVDYSPGFILPATMANPRFWVGLSIGVGAVLLAVASYRRSRLVTLGVAWFALAMLPTTDLIVPIGLWLAERFFYLPSVGLSMIVAAAVPPLLTVPRRREAALLATLGTVVLVGFIVRTWTRNRTWRNTNTVVTALIREHPETMRAQWLLGEALLDRGKIQAGFAALDRAIELNPNSIDPRLERADWLLRLHHPALAEKTLRAIPAGLHPKRGADLARALAGQGRWAAADSALAAARALFPTDGTLVGLSDSLRTAHAAAADSSGVR